MGYRAGFFGAAAAVTSLLFSPNTGHAAAVNTPLVSLPPLETIHGRVSDPIGRPLKNVAVSDGNHVAYTDAFGEYVINESTPGSYQMVASRLGLDPLAPRTVTPIDALKPVDFVATYRLGNWVSPNRFAADTPTALSVSVASYAPTDSCVFWRDAASNATLTLGSPTTRFDETTWTSAFPTDALPAGTYETTAWATDCQGRLLTLVRSAYYVVSS